MTTIVVPAAPNAKPRIGYENLMLDGGGTITFTSENGVNVHENAYDWNPATFWLPNNGTASITTHLPTPRNANYFGCYAHTLADNSGTIVLQRSDDGTTWVDLFPPVAPVDNSPIYIMFDLVASAWYRVKVVSTVASYIGVTAFGQDIVLQRGCFPGFQPPIIARNTKVINSMSQTGVFIGRTFVRNNVRAHFASDMITQQWIRDVWLPFVKHAEMRPWFFYWNYTAWPYETCFAWTNGDITPSAITKAAGTQLMNISMEFDGAVE